MFRAIPGSRPYSFVDNLVLEDSQVDFDRMISKAASLTFKQCRGGQKHYTYHEMVTALERSCPHQLGERSDDGWKHQPWDGTLPAGPVDLGGDP